MSKWKFQKDWEERIRAIVKEEIDKQFQVCNVYFKNISDKIDEYTKT